MFNENPADERVSKGIAALLEELLALVKDARSLLAEKAQQDRDRTGAGDAHRRPK